MQNWDRNLQDVKFKQKLNNIRSTLPKISSANNASSSLISKKQITEKSSSNLNNLENLYINVTNKMKQLTSSPGKTTNVNTHQKKKNTEMKQQNYLKHLLNEFGLSQYLRKLYELGYDDNNINKIGLMSRKKFQELVINMKMYPGQSVKMEKLYEYLKQLNLANTMYNTRLMQGKNNKVKNNINNKKQFNSEVNKRRIKTASGYNNLINNNNMNSNTFGNYPGSTYLNNKNSNTNLNMNNNGERPKTTTNKKINSLGFTFMTNINTRDLKYENLGYFYTTIVLERNTHLLHLSPENVEKKHLNELKEGKDKSLIQLCKKIKKAGGNGVVDLEIHYILNGLGGSYFQIISSGMGIKIKEEPPTS